MFDRKSPIKLLREFREWAGVVEKRPLQILWVCFIVVCLLMCIVNVVAESPKMVAINGGVALWFFVSGLFLWRKKIQYMVYNAMVGVFLMLGYFIVSGGEQGFSCIWVLLVPAVCMNFLGMYYGGILSILFAAFIAVYMWTPLSGLGYEYSATFLVRFPILYIFDLIVCFLMQYRIVKYHNEQEELLQQAESANRSKSDFLANMSHEIRTPMNSIMGMCELILNEEISDEVRENSNNIYISGKNLLGIINDLLDFSKIESGKMDLIEEPYQLSSLLNDVINMAVARKGDKAIEFMVDCDPNIPDKLYGDELRIRQVLINLLTNAIKFTREGGVLFKISARREEYGVNLCFVVQDSGIGIKEENLYKIFQSFSQVDTKKNRAIEGTGLGLAISKRLVNKMGGFIKVESEYGEGTEFTVVIPQKVVEEKVIIEVKERQKVNVLVYIGMNKFEHPFVAKNYKKIIQNIVADFDVKYRFCATPKQAKKMLESEEKYTHLFLAREEYVQDREYFDSLISKMQIVVIQEHKNRIKLTEGIRNIYKPFYVLPVGNAINGERLSFDVGVNNIKHQKFIAPEAKVLVVDDNMMNLKVAMGLMKPYKMSVRTVDSGVETLRLLKSQQFDVIFMDHMMPEMDGVETVHHIREMEGEYYKKVPVVALTANAVSGAREMFLAEGFQDFLAKPIDTVALERILKRWLPKELMRHEEAKDEK
ncbi:MAG: response regulator [Lachnospiraceae bacterium]|nr:response regulator [Lachnospiraceae bacterium]